MKHVYFIEEQTAGKLGSAVPDELNSASDKVVFFSELRFDFFFKSIMENSATDVSFHVLKENYRQWLNIFIKLNRQFPDLRIHAYTDNCIFAHFSEMLSRKIIYSCCFGVNHQKFGTLYREPTERDGLKHIFYRNSEYDYASFNAAATTQSELLIILMPAWNNFFPPFGIAHIAGAVDTLNIPYDVLDLNNRFFNAIEKNVSGQKKYKNLIYWQNKSMYVQNISPDLKFIFDILLKKISRKTKYIGFSIFGTNLLASEEAMQLIRRTYPAIKIFCGGPHATDVVVKSLIERNLIDAAVMGEGEESTLELIRRWESPSVFEPIAGVISNNNGQAVTGPTRALMDINKLPKPNFTKFPLYTYEKITTLPIYTSRGCVAKCSFCSETIYWRKFRAVNPANIIGMMEDSILNFGINYFYFNDSLMNGSHKLLEEMCDQIIEKKLTVKFSGYSRFDNKLTPAVLEKMAKAGCVLMLFGFESGSQKVVDLMNKKVFVDSYESILHNATKAGIDCHVCIIVGFPGETWKDFFSTLIKAIKMKKYLVELNLSIMEISRNSLIEKDFAEYNIVNSQSRYWRTRYWTNFYLLRLTRYLIFKYTWILVSGKGVSLTNWNPGYLMVFKKIRAWLQMKYFFNRFKA